MVSFTAAGSCVIHADQAAGPGYDAAATAQQTVHVQITPGVSNVSPDAGTTSGGQTVTITGTGLVPGASIQFGDATATNVSYQSPSTLTATAPAHGAGLVYVYVRTAAGTSPATRSGVYAYGPPTVTKISPNAGTTNGGQTVTITGTGLIPDAQVAFGAGNYATNVTYQNASTLTATAPAHTTGQVGVTVNTTAGTSPTTQNDLYTYTTP